MDSVPVGERAHGQPGLVGVLADLGEQQCPVVSSRCRAGSGPRWRAGKRPPDDSIVPAGEDRQPVEPDLAGVAGVAQVTAQVTGPQVVGPGQPANIGGGGFPATGRGRNGSGRGAWSWPCPAGTSPVLAGIPGGTAFGGVVEGDGVEELPGDLLAAVQDRLGGGAADEVGQAADHAAGAAVQVVPSALAARMAGHCTDGTRCLGLSDTPFHGRNAWTVLSRYFL